MLPRQRRRPASNTRASSPASARRRAAGATTRDRCAGHAAPGRRPGARDLYAKPVKVFDNLFSSARPDSAWAVTTSDGIIIIDPIFDYSVEEEVVNGLKTLGLDPNSIKAS